MVEDLVVEGEVVAGNRVDAGLLLELPVSGPEGSTGLLEILGGDLAGPVGLSRLLELTESCDG